MKPKVEMGVIRKMIVVIHMVQVVVVVVELSGIMCLVQGLP